MGRVRRTNAKIWVNETNTSGLGHALPWLVSTYGRTAASVLKKGTRSTHVG